MSDPTGGLLGGLVKQGIQEVRNRSNNHDSDRQDGNNSAPGKFTATSLEDGTQVQSAKTGNITAQVGDNSVTVFRDTNRDGQNDEKVTARHTANGDSLEFKDLNTGRTATKENSPLAGVLLDAGFAIDRKFDAREASQANHIVDAAEPPAPAATPAAAPATKPKGRH